MKHSGSEISAGHRYVRVHNRNQYYDICKQGIKRLSPQWFIRLVKNLLYPFTLFSIKREMRQKIRQAFPTDGGERFYRMYEDARRQWAGGEIDPTGNDVFMPIKSSGHEVRLRPGTCDIILYYDIMIQEMYGHPTLDDVQTIVDCGANIGLTSAFFMVIYPSAKVISLEPDPINYYICRKNLEQFGNRSILLNAALWTEPTRVQIEGTQFGTWASSVTPMNDRNKTNSVDAFDVFSVLKNHLIERIDILKIDIEGAEYDIFSAKDLSWLEKVRCIQLETKEPKLETLFIDRLGRYGFSFSRYREIIIAQRA